MDLPHESNPLVAIGRTMAPEHGKGIEPHGKVVKILTVAIRLRPAEGVHAAVDEEQIRGLGDAPARGHHRDGDAEGRNRATARQDIRVFYHAR